MLISIQLTNAINKMIWLMLVNDLQQDNIVNEYMLSEYTGSSKVNFKKSVPNNILAKKKK